LIQGSASANSVFDEVDIVADQGSTEVEVEENESDLNPTPVRKQEPELPAIANPTAPSPLFFAVQLAVSRNDVSCEPQNFKGLEGVWKEEQYGLFKYYCGKISSFKEAEALKTTAVEQYPDAYIVAFEKDRKIDLNEAKKRAP